MTTVASLVVSLGLDSTPYEKGLSTAEKSARTFANQIKASFIGNLGADIAHDFLSKIKEIPAAMQEVVKAAIETGTHLQDLSKRTGIAVETLGGIGFAAKQAGSDLEGATAASTKLNKQLALAASGNAQAAEAFKALGISVKDANGETKSADTVLAEVADKFATYKDGPEKAALALRLFGKAGAEMIPLLDEGGAKLRENVEYFKRYSGITEETAKQSHEFSDTLEKLKLLNGAFGQQLIGELLPTFQNLADGFVGLKEKSTLFQTAAEGIASVFKSLVEFGANVVFVFAGIGREIGAIVAQATYLGEAAAAARGKDRSFLEVLKDPFGARAAVDAAQGAGSGYTAISDAVKADGEAAKKILDDFVKTLNAPKFVADPADAGHEGYKKEKKAAPGIADIGAQDKANAELRKALEGQIKLINDFAQARKDALDFSNKLVAADYADGIITLQAAQAKEQGIRQFGLESELKRQQDIIDAERAFAKRTTNVTDRIDAANKIKEAEQKKTEAVIKGSQAEILAIRANAHEVQALGDRYNDLQVAVLVNTGKATDIAAAAQIRIARQVREAAVTAAQTGQSPDIATKLQTQLEGQERLGQAQRDYTLLIDKSRNAEEQLVLDADAGAQGQIETLRAVGEERARTLQQLQDMADAAKRLADELGTPAALKFADDLALAFKKARAEVDPLAKKFNDIFQNSFADAFTGFITGAKSAKDAFKEFANAVINDITRIAAEDLAKKLFGAGGASGGGGIYGAIGSIAGAIGALFGNGLTVDTSGVGTNTTGTNSPTSGGRAAGGPVEAGMAYTVGEHGPETLQMGSTPGYVIPAGGSRSGPGNVHINVLNQGAPVTAQESGRRQTADGTVIDVVLRAVAKDIRSGGIVHQAASQQYGLNRAAGAPTRS